MREEGVMEVLVVGVIFTMSVVVAAIIEKAALGSLCLVIAHHHPHRK